LVGTGRLEAIEIRATRLSERDAINLAAHENGQRGVAADEGWRALIRTLDETETITSPGG
jgi:hypothetical protein